MRLFIDTERTAYDPEQVGVTMNLEELIEYLSCIEARYGEDVEVMFRNDNGYTYGGITEENINIEEG